MRSRILREAPLRGRTRQFDGEPRRAARRAARRRAGQARRQGYHAGRQGHARRDAPLRARRARRAHPGRNRPRVHGCRQYRHRRLGPGTAARLRGACTLCERAPAAAFRLQRGRRRHRLRARPPGCPHDALHRRIQDLHDAGNDGECIDRHGVARKKAGAQGRRGAPVRRHRRCRARRAIRRALRAHFPVMGLGRRALFPLVGGGAARRAGNGHEGFRRSAGGRARDGRALPQHADRAQPPGRAGLARSVEHHLPGHGEPRGPALR
ncbi:hypothetical protein D3C83_01970 [compost metagenome]